MAKNKSGAKIMIDYPKVNERILSPAYTFRIGSKVEGPVEISINDGPWNACRAAEGYWWFDWRCDKAGKYKAVARVRCEQGETKTLSRRFHAVSPAENLPKSEMPRVREMSGAPGIVSAIRRKVTGRNW